MTKNGKKSGGEKKKGRAESVSRARNFFCPWRKWLIPGLLAAFVVLLILTRTAWYGLLGRYLLVQTEKLKPAELIAVFAGEDLERPRYAASLYNRGFAKKIFASGGIVPDSLQALDTFVPEAEVMSRVLKKAGVPESSIFVVPAGTDTWSEMLELKKFVDMNNINSVILVSSPPHMRRLHWCRKGVFRGSKTVFQYAPVMPSKYGLGQWWKDADTTRLVAGEVFLLLRHAAEH